MAVVARRKHEKKKLESILLMKTDAHSARFIVNNFCDPAFSLSLFFFFLNYVISGDFLSPFQVYYGQNGHLLNVLYGQAQFYLSIEFLCTLLVAKI